MADTKGESGWLLSTTWASPRSVTRRDFLKMGVLTGAALGVGGALTGALAPAAATDGGTSDGGG